MSIRTVTGKVAVMAAGAALIVGLAACGGSSDDGAGPTVADVQAAALQAQQQPGEKYPPLPTPPPVPLYKDNPYPGLQPPLSANELQVAQNPVTTAMQRIQEISAQSADISNRHEEARNYFRQAEPFYDAVKGELDGTTRDKLEKGFDAMHAALDTVAAGDPVKGMEDAEEASGDIQLAVYYFLKDNFDGHDNEQDRETFCSPTGTYATDC